MRDIFKPGPNNANNADFKNPGSTSSQIEWRPPVRPPLVPQITIFDSNAVHLARRAVRYVLHEW